jgi:hypothetical protein
VSETAFHCDNCSRGFAECPVEVEVLSSTGEKTKQWWCEVCFYGEAEAHSRQNARVIERMYGKFIQ